MLLYAYSLTEPYSNNMAENNALIIGLQRINEMGEKYLEAYSNSKLIISQVKGEYDVKNKDLVPYHQALFHGQINLRGSTLTLYPEKIIRMLRP